MTQTPKPDKDEKKTHGNFTKIPNMLCEGAYAQLEHDEKWLYVCVKALCKGKGTRFLSLRYISKKTGYPLSSLSKKLPRLHDAGLVHCEFKKRIDEDGNEFGNAQYHATIADKWDENDAFYGVTCSPDEQDEGEDSKPVHDTNEPVHHANTSVRQTNEPVQRDERTRSRGSTSKDIEDTKDTSKIDEEESIVVSAVAENDAPAANGDPRFQTFIHNFEEEKKRITDKHKAVSSSHSQCLSEEDITDAPTEKMRITKPEQTIASSGPPDAAQRTIVLPPQASVADARSNGAVQASIPKRSRGKVTQAKPAITLTAQEQAFWSLWCAVWFNLDIPPDLTETAYGHVKKLALFVTTSEQLTSLIDFTRKDLAASQNIKRKMVQLGNMVHCYAGWKQAQQQPANNISKNGTDLNQYGLQALLQRQEQKAV